MQKWNDPSRKAVHILYCPTEINILFNLLCILFCPFTIVFVCASVVLFLTLLRFSSHSWQFTVMKYSIPWSVCCLHSFSSPPFFVISNILERHSHHHNYNKKIFCQENILQMYFMISTKGTPIIIIKRYSAGRIYFKCTLQSLVSTKGTLTLE